MIERHLGSGGFGCTYEASYRIMGCNVAIKEFFVKDFCNRGADGTVSVATQGKTELVAKLRNKFFAEARTLFTPKMYHPNIVRVSDVFEENGTVYYAMDYIDGSPLSAIIDKKGRLNEDEALGYISQVADALKHLHSNNCLHLDVKPQNIMVDGDGKAVLIDFGVSKQYDEVSGENTSTLMGHTPGYAPIEQVGRSMVKFNAACDIYALGATLYKALTGQTPVEATLRAGGLGELDFPEYVSDSLRRAIDKAMKISRADRPQSIDEFLSELKGESGNLKTETEDAATVVNPPRPSDNPGGEVKGESFDNEKTRIDDSLIPEGENVTQKTESGKVEDNPKQSEDSQKKHDKTLWVMLLLLIVGVCALYIYGVSGGNGLLNNGVEDPKKDTMTKTVISCAIDGHNYVDLGLPSGLLWATCNVGATSPSDNGRYYAWGETATKDCYTEWNSETYGEQMSDIVGDSIYDVACKDWGGGWRMPTKVEFQELVNNCTWEWTTQDGKNGYKVTSKRNSNSIFLPAAGRCYSTFSDDQETEGFYWSATPDERNSNYACFLRFSKDSHGTDLYGRGTGHSVRPVLNKAKSER